MVRGGGEGFVAKHFAGGGFTPLKFGVIITGGAGTGRLRMRWIALENKPQHDAETHQEEPFHGYKIGEKTDVPKG